MDITCLTHLQQQNMLTWIKANDVSHDHFLIKDQKTLSQLFLPIPKPCHKWAFGHILIMEGHPQFRGASRLAALAALSVGAGLVTIVGKDTSYPYMGDHPEFMRINIDDVDDHFLRKIDVLLIGPGLSKDKLWQDMGMALLKRTANYVSSIIIDADALPLLLKKDLPLKHKIIIATPHLYEALDLLKLDHQQYDENLFTLMRKLSLLPCNQDNKIIWLLKGENSLIRHVDGSLFKFKGEIPLLSSGGMGDVLSGAIAGLIKQSDCGLCALLLAQSMHIEAAHKLSLSHFKGILASQLAMALSSYTKRL